MSSVEDFIDDIDYDKIVLKEQEFMDVYEAFGYGRIEPQKALIFFNKKLLEIEEKLARNPDYGLAEQLQRQKAEIEDYLNKIRKILGPEYQQKETEPVKTKDLPNAILEILKLGFFYDTLIQGKYIKKSGIKDYAIIKWLFDNFPDTGKELIPDIYLHYVHTELKPQTIGQYISRAISEAKN